MCWYRKARLRRAFYLVRHVFIAVSALLLFPCIISASLRADELKIHPCINLAPHSGIQDIISQERLVSAGDTALKEVLEKLKKDYLAANGILYQNDEKLLWLIFVDKNPVYYIFESGNVYFRYSRDKNAEDPLKDFLEKETGSLLDGGGIAVIGGVGFYREIYRAEDNVDEKIRNILKRRPNGRGIKRACDSGFINAVKRLSIITEKPKYASAVINDIIDRFGINLKELPDVEFILDGRLSGRTNRYLTLFTAKKTGGDIINSYVLKTVSYPGNAPSWRRQSEITRSVRASNMHLGPHVVCVDRERGLIIEDRLRYRLHDSAALAGWEDKDILARRFAEKIFMMFDPEIMYIPVHVFDDFYEHTRVIRRGGTIDVVWIDWGKESGYRGEMGRAYSAEGHIRTVLEAFRTEISSSGSAAVFIHRLMELAAGRGFDELVFYMNVYNEVRMGMMSQDHFKESYKSFFDSLDFRLGAMIGRDRAGRKGYMWVSAGVLSKLVPLLGRDFKGDYHHGIRHTVGLLSYSFLLAERLGKVNEIDWKVLSAAATMHDITAGKTELHAETGASRAGYILGRLKDVLTPAERKKAVEAVRLHEERTAEGKKEREDAGIEAQIIYDADQLSAFGAEGIYRYIAVYSARGDTLNDIKRKVLPSIESRFESMHFADSRELGRSDYILARDFFERLRKSNKGAEEFAEFIIQNIRMAPEEIGEKGRRHFAGNEYLVRICVGLEEAYSRNPALKTLLGEIKDRLDKEEEKRGLEALSEGVGTPIPELPRPAAKSQRISA